MNIFKKLFSKNKINNLNNNETNYNTFNDINMYFNKLENSNHYIARSEYKEYIKKYNNYIELYNNLINTNMLDEYCAKNKIDVNEFKDIVSKLSNMDTYVSSLNDIFIDNELIKEKSYLDNILKSVDSKIILDENQRKVVLSDEDYTLVVAGAGAGKTTTVAARVKYLVEKRNVDPRTILVISFTNKAVKELKQHINKELKIDCPIATFHSTGYAILRKQEDDNRVIVDSSKLYYVLQDYFKNSILKNESLVNKLILFFSSYFDAPFEGEDLNNFFNKIVNKNYTTLKGDLEEYSKVVIDSRTKKKVTISNEFLKSREEVEIANFLYLNNIDYEYEPVYKYNILYARKPYTPDFIIKQGNNVCYIEHFGITEDGHNDRYSLDELERYKNAVNDKILLHRKHGTKLIYTFSKYKDKRSISEHLKEELIKNGFTLKPKSNEEVMKKIVSNEENKYIRKLINLVMRFINNFKTDGFDVSEFERMYHKTTNVRSKLFLSICNECYLEYEKYLKEHNAVDFQDMINESVRILNEVEAVGKKLDFNYIIVDEYQDISKQRFDLVKTLAKVTNAKIMAVGDDWQSIYAFSGSDISLFTKFEEKMGYAKLLKIVNTYRNSQDVIDIAGNFIQKNKSQIIKTLHSPKTIKDPVVIYTYDNKFKRPNESYKLSKNYAICQAILSSIESIIEYNKEDGKKEIGSILLIGRYGFDGFRLEGSGLFEYLKGTSKIRCVKHPELDITFMTAHSSKGLGFDNVIVINCSNDLYGFPSKIEEDPVLSFVTKEDKTYEYAEERRLFYVAMTRTKNRVYLISPQQNPSLFVLELVHDYKNIIVNGILEENTFFDKPLKKTCPLCGYPLQYRYKPSYGLPLYICTNEQELCGFMTNDFKGEKLSIMKCDKCVDGYLTVRHNPNDNSYFLGCTNYKKDGTGCNNKMDKITFYKMHNYEITENMKRNYAIKDYEENNLVYANDFLEYKEEPVEKIVKYINSQLDNDLENINNNIYIILQTLVDISNVHFYGVSVLIDVLRGSLSKQVISRDLDKVEFYGKLKDVSRDDLKYIIEYLIEKHFILQTNGLYPVLHSTYEGLHYNKFIKVKDLEDINNNLKEEIL